MCCRLLCDPHPECFFSSSTWWTRSSCHTLTPGWAGSPGNPLEQSNKARAMYTMWTDKQRKTFITQVTLHRSPPLSFAHSQIIITQCEILLYKILPLTFPMVGLEFRPIIGSVATPVSLPLSKKEEERRQAVPTCPGWASPWTTCSPRSSCK